ncbi:hypothetical protein LOD99_15346 [Oopsacas minuta]|uniref:Uncharacterized protein n=1 Tax=Oopsacas minuta TaxID=111878 RepID=A0AAV7KBV1_9METZ|nr:hypothetical protein LOD99_15346 [Oopsacas minuta]
MSELVAHDVRSVLTNSKQPRKIPLMRTKPIDSFTDLCQQLTNVVAHQTALSEKLIEAFRETKDSQNNLQIPYMDNSNRVSPVPDTTLEFLTRQSSFVSYGSTEEEEIISSEGKGGIDSLNWVVSNIDTIRTCTNAAMNQIRAISQGQVQQEKLQGSLSQIYSMMSLMNTQCGVCKTGLMEFERKLNYISIATSECKSTQTECQEVDTGESDADDKDSGLESNSGRVSETGISLEDFHLYTDYDELMQAPVPEEVREEMTRRPSFLKDKKHSCPTNLLERKIKTKIKNPIERAKETSFDETREEPVSSPGKSEQSDTKPDDTLKLSPNTSSDVFSLPSDSIETLSVQSISVQNEGSMKDQITLESPRQHRLQRSKTMCNPTSSKHGGFSEDEDSLGFNVTEALIEGKVVKSDFANLESQVNIIKLNYSTNSFTSKGRKNSLQSLVFGTRKQISSEINDLLSKINSNRRRKMSTEDIILVEDITKSLFERIDQLMQLSQQFGAILHETTHSDEKEILINFIEMVKTLHRPTSIPVSGAISFTCQNSDSVVSSGDNDRWPASPTLGQYTYKAVETNYEKGVNEGLDYMKCKFQTEINTKNEKLEKLFEVSNIFENVLNLEIETKNIFILTSGGLIVLFLIISVIIMFFL